MFNNICQLDFSRATKSGTDYTFTHNVYNAVAMSNAGFATNMESDLFTPFRAVKNNGYFRLEFMGNSTSMYVSVAAPTVVSATQPS